MELYIKATPWDNHIFQLNTGRLLIELQLNLYDIKTIQEQSKMYDFIVIKNDNSFMTNHYYLSLLGHAYITDLQMKFTLTQKTIPSFDNTPNIFIQNGLSFQQDIMDLSREVYRYSRFYNDPYIPKEQADIVYQTWCKDSFHDSQKYYIYYQKGTHILAYLLFYIREDTIITDLQATHKELQGQGIGQILLTKLLAFGYQNNITKFQMGTQASNKPMISLYQKFGYHLKETSTIYHYWPEKI